MKRPGLLVSVRSVAEAEAALAGGADLIDVKEPNHGPLGRASDQTIADIICRVAGQRPVSAAMGELGHWGFHPLPAGLRYCKWGLAGLATRHSGCWQQVLLAACGDASDHSRTVAVAYADYQTARSPEPDAICSFACDNQLGAFLVDTFCKDGRTLLDCLALPKIAHLCEACRIAGVPVALAGSLSGQHLAVLRDLRPDWFAVRGAVCIKGRRENAIASDRVRQLANILAG